MSWATRLLKNLSAEDQDSITFTCLKSARQELSHAVGSAGKAPRLAARPATVTSSSGASEHVGTCRSRVQLRDKGGTFFGDRLGRPTRGNRRVVQNRPAHAGHHQARLRRDTKGIDWISERCLLAS